MMECHIFLIEFIGTQMSTNGGAGSNTIIYFSSSRAMIIRNGTFLFREVGFDGVAVEVDVLVDQAPNQRRLSSLLTEDKSCSQYLHRCSVKSGVCFHTYDEIVSLHADSMIVGNNEASRRLDSEESYITFAEIQANVEILSKDNLSSIDRASALITGLMKNFTSSKGRVTLSFQMSERCVNYPDLVADCNGFPVPDVIYADQDLASLLTPFTGLVPSDGRWVFRDSIEYSIDPYTIQLKVIYSF